jgi:hypothetical protein
VKVVSWPSCGGVVVGIAAQSKFIVHPLWSVIAGTGGAYEVDGVLKE